MYIKYVIFWPELHVTTVLLLWRHFSRTAIGLFACFVCWTSKPFLPTEVCTIMKFKKERKKKTTTTSPSWSLAFFQKLFNWIYGNKFAAFYFAEFFLQELIFVDWGKFLKSEKINTHRLFLSQYCSLLINDRHYSLQITVGAVS